MMVKRAKGKAAGRMTDTEIVELLESTEKKEQGRGKIR
jgi:hypothetical protein